MSSPEIGRDLSGDEDDRGRNGDYERDQSPADSPVRDVDDRMDDERDGGGVENGDKVDEQNERGGEDDDRSGDERDEDKGRERDVSRSPVRRDDSRERKRSRSRSPSKDKQRSRSRSRSRRRSRSRDRERRRYSRSRSRDRSRDRRRSPRRYRSPRRRSPPPRGLHLFVAGLNFIISERELHRKFSKYGRVREARIVRNSRSGESRGFGFVVMDAEDEVDRVIRHLNGREWNGRSLLVERARNVK